MPIAPTYPGVYIEEIPSGVRTITGVSTSVAAFVDYFPRGPMNSAIQLFSYADFEREFGGLNSLSEASYAIRQFFLNGGTHAWVVRVASGSPARAGVMLLDNVVGGADALSVTAVSEGTWGNQLRVTVDYDTSDPASRFNLTVTELDPTDGHGIVRQEIFRDLSMDNVEAVVNHGSGLIEVTATGGVRPVASGTLSGDIDPFPSLGDVAISRQVGVTIDSTGHDVDMGTSALGSLDEAALRLQSAIRSANPGDPVWAETRVLTSGAQLQVIPGMADPDAIVTFAAATSDATTVTDLNLSAATTENVAHYQVGVNSPTAAQGAGIEGDDGTPPDAAPLIGSEALDPPTGLFALNKVSLFNILCLPRIARVSGTGHDFDPDEVDSVIEEARNYCVRRRAFLLLDTPSDVVNLPQIRTWLNERASLRDKNVALYFPRLLLADPLDEHRPRSFGASGTMAGLYARTDTERGVWKAPAGAEAVLRNVPALEYVLTDPENGTLNQGGINCLRSFPVYGNVSWGARTLLGSDQHASEWKYVPIRRLALFIEESLYRGTQWVVFEPNDEPLWSQVRLNVGAFMNSLFRQGAFQGQTKKDAYLVKCDAETTTQNDIDRGIVNILVGFAPLKPAEFVIIKIQQLAGQIQA